MDGFAFKKEPLESVYEVDEDIGSGHFAVVRRVTHRATGHAYAAKFIRKRRGGGRKGARMEDIHKEVSILRQLNHSNIINLYDVYETSLEVILILELVTGGELFDYISEKDHLGEEEASSFIAQILHGVKHLHNKNIAHLDLKPENIMLLNRNSQRIKLIDFGLAQRISENDDIRALMGTAEFVAPEVVSYESLSLATDMWSIGVITYILLSGASPFLGDTQQETYHNITAINYHFDPEYFAHTSDLAKDFIRKLFVKNPRKRATVEDCLNHPWIRPREQNEKLERKSAVINMDNFKAFMARKRWKQSMRVVSLCNRLSKSMLLRKSTDTLGSRNTLESRNTLDEEGQSKLHQVVELPESSAAGGDQTLDESSSFTTRDLPQERCLYAANCCQTGLLSVVSDISHSTELFIDISVGKGIRDTNVEKRISDIAEERKVCDIDKEKICDIGGEQIRDIDSEEKVRDIGKVEICDKEKISDIDRVEICDKEEISDIDKVEICDKEEISDIDKVEICDKEEKVTDISSVLKIADTGGEEKAYKNRSEDTSDSDNEDKICSIGKNVVDKEENINDIVKEEQINDMVIEEQMSDIVKEEQVCDIVKEEQISDMVKEEEISDMVKEEQMSDFVKEEQVSDIVKEKQMSDIKEEQASDMVKEEQMSDMVKEEQVSDMVKKEQVSNMVKEEQMSDIANEECVIGIVKEQISDIVKEKQMSDFVKEEQVSDMVKEEQMSDMVKEEHMSDIANVKEQISDIVKEQINDIGKEEQIIDIVKEELISDMIKEKQTSDIGKEEQVSDIGKEEQ